MQKLIGKFRGRIILEISQIKKHCSDLRHCKSQRIIYQGKRHELVQFRTHQKGTRRNADHCRKILKCERKMQSLVTHFKSQKKELIHSPCISASLTWSPVSSVNINEDSWLKCEITQWQIKCKKIKWDERFLWIKSRYVGIPPHFKSSCQLSSEFSNFRISCNCQLVIFKYCFSLNNKS